MKNQRQAKIMEIISNRNVETQEQLLALLQQEGFRGTQATISRDIKDLRLFKVAGVQKKYRYAHIHESTGEISPKMKSLFADCVVSIRCAQNIVVVKTLPGNGNNAGSVIDKLNFVEIIGSVAGDDTVFAVCDNAENALLVVEKIHEFLK